MSTLVISPYGRDPALVQLDPSSTASELIVPAAPAAVVTGTTDASAGGLYGAGGSLNGLTLILNSVTLTLAGAGNTATFAALQAAIAAGVTGVTAAVQTANGNKLKLSKSGAGATITVGAGTANTLLGLTQGTYTKRSWVSYVDEINPATALTNVFLASTLKPYPNALVPTAAARGFTTASGGTLVIDDVWSTARSIPNIPPGALLWVNIINVYPDTTITDLLLLS